MMHVPYYIIVLVFEVLKFEFADCLGACTVNLEMAVLLAVYVSCTLKSFSKIS